MGLCARRKKENDRIRKKNEKGEEEERDEGYTIPTRFHLARWSHLHLQKTINNNKKTNKIKDKTPKKKK